MKRHRKTSTKAKKAAAKNCKGNIEKAKNKVQNIPLKG